MRKLLITFAATLTVLMAAGQQTPTLSSIVDASYPPELAQKAAQEGRADAHQFSYAVLTRRPDGQPALVVVAYSNGADATVQMTQLQDGTLRALDEEDAFGAFPEVATCDVDGDGNSEVVVRFTSATGLRSMRVYRWTGTALNDLMPTDVTLDDPGFVDLFHDGTLQLIGTVNANASQGSAPVDQRLYRLTSSGFTVDSQVLYLGFFVRHKGKPNTQTEAFSVPSTQAGPVQMQVINGEKTGAQRLSSATISINGTVVASPSAFNQKVEFLSVALSNLKAGSNQVSVTLDGAPGSQLTILIRVPTVGGQAGTRSPD